MTAQLLPKDSSLSRFVSGLSILDNIAKSILLKKLTGLKHGSLRIEDRTTNPTKVFKLGDDESEIKVSLTIKRTSFYSRTLLGGSIGNAESYVDKDWEADNLTNLVRLFVKNRELLQGLDSGLGNIFAPIQKLVHGFRSNSIKGSRENIRAHYDIGNDFFKLFLDPTMMYSSGVFINNQNSMEEASLNKLYILCERLKLKPEDHLLEIGTGWGGLAIFAAKNYGCKVTTTTISTEQYEYAKARIKEEGLEHLVTLLFKDYRLLDGVYDKLVSVEMIEAVGLDHLDTYFKKCSSLLKNNGLMVLQAITIRDQYYEQAKRSVDFIQRHIFPGSGIPCPTAMLNSIQKNTDLIISEQQDYAEDYAQTIFKWAERLAQNQDQIVKLGYPDYLYRLWQYYFAYCEGGFRERAIGLSHMTLCKPAYRNRSLV